MSVYSMTGYASLQLSTAQAPGDVELSCDNGQRLGIEIRSVNSRFLDLAFRLPDEMRQVEPALRDLLTGIFGLLDGTGPSARIAAMWVGESCNFR